MMPFLPILLAGHILVTVDVQRTSSEADDGTDIEFLTTIKFWQWVALLNTYALRAEVGLMHAVCNSVKGFPCGYDMIS